MDHHGPRPDRGGDRGAPAGRAAEPLLRRRQGHPGPPPAADARRRAARTPRPTGSTPRRCTSAAAPSRGRPRRRFFTPRRLEVVERLEDEAMLPAIYFIFSRAACDDARDACLDAGLRLTTPDERARIRAIVEERTASPGRRRPRRPRLRPLARRPRGGRRRAPRRDGAAVQGGGGGVLHRGAREGRVRHRDAGARHQHAGPHGRHREADQVHRRAPRAPHAGRVHAAHGPGRAPRHRRASATPSCCGRRSCPFEQVAALASSRTFRARARRSGPPTTWPPTSCGATTPERGPPPPQPVLRPVPGRPGGRAPRDPARAPAGAPRRGCGRRRRCERGDVDEYRRLRAEASERAARAGLRAGGRVDRIARRRRPPAPGRRASCVDGTAAAPCSAWPTARATRGCRSSTSGSKLLTLGADDCRAARGPSARSSCPSRTPRTTALPAPGRRGPAPRPARREAAASRRRRRRGRARSPADEAFLAAEAHPVADCPDRDAHLAAAVQAERVGRELDDLRRQVRGRTESLARRFDRVLRLLEAWGYLDGWALTEQGQTLARIYHECDLLVAECDDHGAARRPRRRRRWPRSCRASPTSTAARPAACPVVPVVDGAGAVPRPRARSPASCTPTRRRPGCPPRGRPTRLPRPGPRLGRGGGAAACSRTRTSPPATSCAT